MRGNGALLIRPTEKDLKKLLEIPRATPSSKVLTFLPAHTPIQFRHFYPKFLKFGILEVRVLQVDAHGPSRIVDGVNRHPEPMLPVPVTLISVPVLKPLKQLA
jgi:hypothetical protein